MSPVKRLAALLTLIPLLSACGGGGDGSPPPPNSGGPDTPGDPTPPPAPSGRYLFFQSGNDGPLMAVDPATPATPLQVSNGDIQNASLAAIGHGNFDLGTQTISNLHTRTIIYAEGGKLWRIGTFKAGGLTPTQLSSESGATTVCRSIAATNLYNHDYAAYLYELPGGDGNCGGNDNLWKMVYVGMDSSAAPLPAKEPLTSLDDSTTGKHHGWLVAENGTLMRYNADFTNGISVKDGGGTAVTYSAKPIYYGPINIALEVLRLDGAIGTYFVDGNLWQPRANVASNYADLHNIRENGVLYYADPKPGDTSVLNIYRANLTSITPSVVLLAHFSDFDLVQDKLTLRRTGQKLMLARFDKSLTATTVVNISKSEPTTLSNPPTVLTGGTVAGELRSFIANGNNIYYSFDLGASYLTDGTSENYTADNPPLPNLSSNFSGGSNTTAAWLGAVQPNQITVGNTQQPQIIFLAEGFSDATEFAEGTLTRYDATSAVRGSRMGTIPPGIKEIHIEGNRSITLAQGTRADNGTRDIFLVDIDTPDSLFRVTEDNIDDLIIDAYH